MTKNRTTKDSNIIDNKINTTYIEYEGKKIQKTTGLNCPVCTNSLEINYSLYEIPEFGNVNLIAYSCSKCTYKSSEMMPVDKKEPYRYEYTVNSQSDLYTKLVRGPDTSIEIKDLGISLEPGGSASFFHTSVESILIRFRNAVDSMIRSHRLILIDSKNNDEIEAVNQEIVKMQEILSKIEGYLEGKEFTLILEAKEGHGAILSNEAIKIKLDDIS